MGEVSIYPNLFNLIAGTKYGIVIESASSVNGNNCYGFGYSDSNPYAGGYQRYSGNGGSSWTTESSGNRDLKFITYRKNYTADQDNSSASFTPFDDMYGSIQRLQLFKPSTSNLPQVDFYTFKVGSPAGPLTVQIVSLDGSDNPSGILYTTDIPAASVSASLGAINIYPNLTNLTAGTKYGVLIKSANSVDGDNSYGFGYSDSNPYADGYQKYSNNAGSSWTTESSGNRDLKFTTYKKDYIVDQYDVSASFNTSYDVYGSVQRLQIFTPSTSNLPKVDFYTFKTGSPAGALTVQVVSLDGSDNPTGTLYTTDIPAVSVSGSLGVVSIYPNLSNLTGGTKYGILIKSPNSLNGSNCYGFGYNDSNPYADGFQRYSNNGGSSWTNEASGNRDLKFATFK